MPPYTTHEVTNQSTPFEDVNLFALDNGRLKGGLVQTLRRTHVGPFAADSGLSLDATMEQVRASLRPMGEAVVELPRVTLDASTAGRFMQGQAVPCGDATGLVGVFRGDVFVGTGEAAAGRVRPKVVV